MKSGIFKACLAALIVLGLACSSDSPTQPGNPPSYQPPDLSKTPRENREAEIAAMVLSHELVAPQWLYERIRKDLEQIRATFGDSLPVRIVAFSPYWKPSSISARIDQAVLADTASGARSLIDSLNAAYRCTSESNYWLNWYNFRFEGVLNSHRLVDVYAKVPSMEVVCPEGPGPGDHSEIYLWQSRNAIQYFFRYAFGDCPSGCIYSVMFYFKTTDRELKYLGYYPHDLHNPEEPKPAWFDTLLTARDLVRNFDCWEAQ